MREGIKQPSCQEAGQAVPPPLPSPLRGGNVQLLCFSRQRVAEPVHQAVKEPITLALQWGSNVVEGCSMLMAYKVWFCHTLL